MGAAALGTHGLTDALGWVWGGAGGWGGGNTRTIPKPDAPTLKYIDWPKEQSIHILYSQILDLGVRSSCVRYTVTKYFLYTALLPNN
jgi:hypothetical protein